MKRTIVTVFSRFSSLGLLCGSCLLAACEEKKAEVKPALPSLGVLASAKPDDTPTPVVDSASRKDDFSDMQRTKREPTDKLDEKQYALLVDIAIRSARECWRSKDPARLDVKATVAPDGKVTKVELKGRATEVAKKGCIEAHFTGLFGPPFKGEKAVLYERSGFLYADEKKDGP